MPPLTDREKEQLKAMIDAGEPIPLRYRDVLFAEPHEPEPIRPGKTAEPTDSLRESERRFRLVVEAAPNAVVMVDRAGKIVMVNAQAERVFGYSRAELVGQPVEMLVPERFRGHHPGLRETFFVDPQPRLMGAERDLYGLKKDGSEFPVEIGLNPIETEEGTIVLSAVVDITERKAAELALRESERRYSLLVDGVTDYAIFMLDPNGIVTNWNTGAERIKGYRAEEIIGRHFSCFYTEEDRAAGVPQRALEIAARDGRFEAESLARAQGRPPLLGQRGDRRDQGRQRPTDRLRQDHARHYRAHPGGTCAGGGTHCRQDDVGGLHPRSDQGKRVKSPRDDRIRPRARRNGGLPDDSPLRSRSDTG